MRHLRPLSAVALDQTPARLGANLHTPSKASAPAADWDAARALLSSLPKGTPVRDDLLFHEYAWDKALEYGSETIRAKLGALAVPGGPIVLAVIPIPWPGSFGWSTWGSWGYVDERDVPHLAARFARLVTVARAEARSLGIAESRLVFHIGNEPAAGHPGGWNALPPGEWWDRHGRLCLACLKKARFGYAKVAAPSISMQDHDEATASRERESAAPILEAVARYVDYASVHSRTYAPHLGAKEYAALAVRNMRGRLALASKMTGGKPAICPEWYLFREDRGAVDDRAEVLALMSPQLPALSALYRIGGGPNDPSTQIPVTSFVSAVAAARTVPDP